MATNNAVNVSLAGQTGTGTFVGNTAPTLTQVAFSTTSGIIGTTTNNNAAAGSVGEYVESQITTPVAFSSTISNDVGSISLTAGDWDVWGNIYCTFSGNVTQMQSWINTTSATSPAGIYLNINNFVAATVSQSANCVMQRLSLSGTTTVYLSGNFTFSTGTASAQGYIGARRRR